MISDFNAAEKFKWQGGVWAAVSVCAYVLHVRMQIDTFVLFVLQNLSQDHRHFGNSLVKDKYVIEYTGCEGGFRRFDRKRAFREKVLEMCPQLHRGVVAPVVTGILKF